MKRMMNANHLRYWMQYTAYLPSLLLALMGLLLLGAVCFYNQWHVASTYNEAYRNQTSLNIPLTDDNALLALQHNDLISQEKQTADTIKQRVHALTLAEAAKDSHIRGYAKFAVGNLYFDLSAISGDIAAGGSHQQSTAQIALAREAYKSALRIKPNMYVARFNLELLDRLSPEKRTQAWQSETDGVTLQPFKRNGTAMMKDNTRRGLP